MSLPQLNWLQVSSDSYRLRKHLIYLDLNLFVVWLPTEILWKLGTHLWVAIQRPRHQNKTREIWSEFHAVCCRRKYKVTETWPGLSAAAQARLFLIRTGTWQCKKKKFVFHQISNWFVIIDLVGGRNQAFFRYSDVISFWQLHSEAEKYAHMYLKPLLILDS